MKAKEFLEYKIDNDYGGTELGDTLMDNIAVITELLESYASLSTPTRQISDEEIEEESGIKAIDNGKKDSFVNDMQIAEAKSFIRGAKWVLDQPLPTKREEEWISVKDRLPNINKVIAKKTMYESYKSRFNGQEFIDEESGDTIKPTHWKPPTDI